MIIGLAGHVDHGKSALVTALTGIATDRHPEERQRGITIDLQAVALRDDRGVPTVALVDVPGHEDFLRAMVAGASGIAAVLLVIAADEGVMPQTREHLLVLERLGVPRGVPILTKVDLVDPELADLAAEEVRELLVASPIAFDAPMQVSARTGIGIAALREHLLALAANHTVRDPDDHFRLPVDKVFSRSGVGTILTGTTWSGHVRVGDAVRLLPPDIELRVRTLESHATAMVVAGPGVRLAVGVSGLDRHDVRRGDVLVQAVAPWPLTTAFDAWVTLAPAAGRPLDGRRRARIHLGTAEVAGRVLPRGSIAPGASGLARVALDRPVVARGGDHFVLRSWSPTTTIGGGVVVDPLPPSRAPWPAELGDSNPGVRLGALVVRRRFGLAIDDVPFVLGIRAKDVSAAVIEGDLEVMGRRLVPRTLLKVAEARVLNRLKHHHISSPQAAGLSIETLRRAVSAPAEWADALVARLVGSGRIVVRDGLAALKEFRPQADLTERAMPKVLAALRAGGLQAPTAAALSTSLGEPGAAGALRVAESRGEVVQVERGWWVTREAADGFAVLLRELGAGSPIALASVRERTGLSRKFLIPLLEWADRAGITRREGENRVLIARR